MLLILLAHAASVPDVSVKRGLYETPFDVALSGQAGDTFRYSLDGGLPTTPYAGVIPVSRTTVLRAQAVAEDGSVSAIGTYTYLFLEDVLTQAGMDTTVTSDPTSGPIVARTLRELPTMSLVMPGALVGVDIELPVSIEWIPPTGDDAQIDCGAEIIGGTSYAYEKTSVRLHFRSSYGEGTWRASLYEDDGSTLVPADAFDSITLRSGNHDSVFYLGEAGQYTRNYWMDLTQLEQGQLAPHGRYFHLYFNGEYRGLYHLRERFDAAYMAEYLGGEEEDYEAINGGTAFDGSGSAWSSLLAHASDFDGAQPWLNVPDFLDYMVLNFYAANAWDWSPDHNWIAAGPTEAGEGGFVFHSSDSDICLYYDPSTNILNNGGPSYLFYYLLTEGHPDFLVALRDALHRNLEDDGPLTVARATDRYQRIAAEAEEGVVAESARWGGGWWRQDEAWVTERDWLVETFFAQRTELLLGQVRAAGWYPLPGATFDTPSGVLAPGTVVGVAGAVGELWLTTDGEDPREPGGAVYAGATGPGLDQAVEVQHGTVVKARLRMGTEWGPLSQRLFEADEAPAIVLNEWNATAPDELLEDVALGALAGGGGDWLELLVIEDHLDLRGWSLVTHDRSKTATIRFTDAALLSDLRAGTLLTIAEDLPEDPTYDPDASDWRFHLRAGPEGSGTYVSATAFDVTERDWQAEIVDADGKVRVGTIGEGVVPRSGIADDEVGLLAETPSPAWRRWNAVYVDGEPSTFGAANLWDDGAQDLSVLRGVTEPTLGSGDSGFPAALTTTTERCGCRHGSLAPALTVLLAAVLLRRRSTLLLVGCTTTETTTVAPKLDCFVDADRDGHGDTQAIVCGGAAVSQADDCDDQDASVHPKAAELCDGRDQDCDALVDEEPIDGLPFFVDEDGDGYGTLVERACSFTSGLALKGGDCDDGNAAISPGATERCDEVDDDCDGVASDSVGSAADCAVDSCAEALAAGVGDGATWIRLPSGTVTEVYCDQTRDGGGWTLGFLRNSVSTGSQGDFGEGEVGLDGLATSPDVASTSDAAALGWIDLNDFPYETLVVAAYASGGESVRSRGISRSELRVAFGDDGYKLYGGASGYYWCGGNASYTDGGVGQVNPPSGGYADCKGHGSLGSGWDFSEADSANAGLTLCGGDASAWLGISWGSGSIAYYGSSGGAQAIWVR